MKGTTATFLLSILAACGTNAQPTAAETTAETHDQSNTDVYEVKVESKSVPANFNMKEPSRVEQAAEVTRLENEFRQYSGGEVVRATYRYLKSGDLALVERAAYIGSSPAYAHYMGVKGEDLVSVVCVSHKPFPGVIVSSSNCADAVGIELGSEYRALIRNGGDND